MRTALTIAGSDSSGGAGIQADIKAMTMNGVFAMSAVTALTAQNTTGVSGIMEATSEFLRQQLDMVFTDIFPDAVKIGMVSSSGLIRAISEALKFYSARNIVVDPVMVSTSGAKLITDDAVKTLADELLPLATIATPNIPEAEILSGMKISGRDDMERAGAKISADYGCSVLVKGGHAVNDADDVLCEGEKFTW
ncbi:MAG: bifunctional hydroxymethylpyrimidine kinase/phosphomethylpyrimidine kinase, partial [Synergistaceae bacterium]|nr:bifunctional hydroxymethylpyrimidine kinase/phosphomethylpyrimidine kinase [Synergistaceae bacterium]